MFGSKYLRSYDWRSKASSDALAPFVVRPGAPSI